MSEEIYDQEIAPELRRLAERCKELGMSFIAQVEFSAHNTARTEVEIPGASCKQKLVHWAARSNGNVDSLFMAVDRHGKEHGHSSIYLKLAGNDNIKYSGNEVAAIAVITP